MIRFLGTRLVWGLVVLFTVAVITFVLTYIVPADPARAIVGIRGSADDVARTRAALGLDQPFIVQLVGYLARTSQGDLGHSYHHRVDVLPLILSRVPATAQLAVAGISLSLLIGVPLGVIAARRRGTGWDRAATILSGVLVSVPAFWLGYLLIDLLAFRPLMAFDLAIFPIGGYEPWDLRYLALPALTIGATGAAYYTRLTRSAMLDELHQDYVRTARAKGLHDRRVTWRHAFRNSLPPLLTQLGLDLGFFLGGVVVVEQVFSWPGVGRLAVDSITNTDVPLIMGTVLFGTFCIVMANLLVDVVIALMDPRIRY
jgi:peptide/nickel transport system permease protein